MGAIAKPHIPLYQELHLDLFPTITKVGEELINDLSVSINSVKDAIDGDYDTNLESAIQSVKNTINTLGLKYEKTSYYFTQIKRYLEDAIDRGDISKAHQALMLLETIAKIVSSIARGATPSKSDKILESLHPGESDLVEFKNDLIEYYNLSISDINQELDMVLNKVPVNKMIDMKSKMENLSEWIDNAPMSNEIRFSLMQKFIVSFRDIDSKYRFRKITPRHLNYEIMHNVDLSKTKGLFNLDYSSIAKTPIDKEKLKVLAGLLFYLRDDKTSYNYLRRPIGSYEYDDMLKILKKLEDDPESVDLIMSYDDHEAIGEHPFIEMIESIYDFIDSLGFGGKIPASGREIGKRFSNIFDSVNQKLIELHSDLNALKYEKVIY